MGPIAHLPHPLPPLRWVSLGVITRMVLPFRASLFSLSAIRRIFCPSRPLVGSSRINILRPEKMAQAMARRCFCPPDRADGCASLYS